MTFSTVVSAEQMVTLYSPSGDTINVLENEVQVFTPLGWSRNINDVRTLIYSYRGSAYVPNNQVEEYLSLGWSLTPVRVDWETPLPTTLLSTYSWGTYVIDIKRFDVYDFEYLPSSDKIRIHYDFEYDKSGYMSLCFKCYDSNGTQAASLSFSEYADYIDVPSSTATFVLEPDSSSAIVSGAFEYRHQVDMYAPDGRVITVYDIQAPIYERVGWASAVEMYSLDGRTITIPPYEVEAYKAVGWYTFEGYLYTEVKSSYDACISSSQYDSAILITEMFEDEFKGTEYEYSVQLLKEGAMDKWRNSTRCPLGYIGSSIGDYYGTPEADITFRNISYKKIVAFKLKFTCYNIFGNVERTYYDSYYTDSADLNSGEAATYTWTLYGADSVNYITNVKITEVVYSDGTKWKR